MKAHRFHAARQMGALPVAKKETETSEFTLVASPVLGQLIGSDKATATGITVRGPSPVLALCRKLVAAGVDPNRSLHAYRGDLLCLVVRSIGEAAQFDVNSKGTGFTKYRVPVRIASPVRPGVPGHRICPAISLTQIAPYKRHQGRDGGCR
jgi:hypothetical protein